METDNSLVEAPSSIGRSQRVDRESVLMVLKEMLEDALNGKAGSKHRAPALQRCRDVVVTKAPRLKRAVKLTSSDIAHWMNRGGPWRTSLVITTGIISLIGLTGVFTFLLFLVTATINSAVVALLGSVAAIGAAAAVFFTALVAIYIGAISIAAFVISVIVVLTIAAALTAAGWIAFAWIMHQAVKKCFQVVRGSLAMTAATIHTVSTAGQMPLQAPVIAVERKSV